MNIELKRILCPVDFSDNSLHALNYAIALAQRQEADLVLLHVVQPSLLSASMDPFLPEYDMTVMENYMDACKRQLKELTERVVAQDHPATTSVLRTGTPFLEIVTAARELDSDLIVVGTHGRTGLAHVMIGSVAEKVVRKAPCPVLTVKHPEHEFVMP
jgi:nucleotide-binding universal stress UspA family protein